MRISWGIGMFLLLSPGTEAHSQGLSLDSLIRMGLRNNPDLLVGRDEGGIAASDTLSATSYNNPSLAFEVGYNVTDPAKPKASVRLSKEFQSGFPAHRNGVARASLAADRQSQRARELETVEEIRAAWFSWQILACKNDLQREVEKRWESLARIAAAKVKEWRMSQVDEAQAQLNRAKARQKELEFLSGMESLQKRLAYLTGSTAGPDSIAPFPIETPPQVPALDSLYLWADGENADLKTLALDIETRRRQVDLEQSLRTPSWIASVGYDKETDGNNVVGGGLEFPLPLFNRNQAGLAKSRAELRAAESRGAAAATRIKAGIAGMHAGLVRLSERYQSHQLEIRPLSRKQLELSEKGFLQGLLGIFDLSRVQEEYLSQEMDALDILDAYYDQWNRLGKAVGGKTW